ncbi:sugar phosphate nucleotidyltransferase [Desulfogranum marinum]|uniref:sugar phosphate nucleotidyltransferase n=1 Tax=Desulfogranum marinum TaxID=453220 RepID=UPI001965AFAF|nr:sugar phosphate nucleotidyltransferase [Desulfogranum marinum]MBM9512783.1 NTP transferase domain-containing protein [Desulfogranum marinum]
MQAILLAAGFGTRLRPFTEHRPKPLFPVLNTPLLIILLHKLRDAGCTRIVVNCHHLAEQIKKTLSISPDIHVQHEPEILGTGGSLRKALPQFVNEPVLVMNGDIYHDIDLAVLYQTHLCNQYRVTLAMHDFPRFNTVSVAGDRICSFQQSSQGEKQAFTGIHVVDPDVLELIPQAGFFHIIDLYEELARDGQVGIFSADNCFWRDIGTPADYLDLHRELLTDVQGQCRWHISSGAQVASDAVFDDWGAIGKGCVVGSGARLARSVLWDNATVDSGSVIEDRIVMGDGDGE